MNKLLIKLLLTSMLIYVSYPAIAADEWRSNFPTATLVGSGILKVFFMDIYKVRLYSDSGHYSSKADFILEFEYLKPVSKETIIDASIKELSRLTDVTSKQKELWSKILNKGIVDMGAGETASVSFLKSGKIIFESPDGLPMSFDAPKFTHQFASIWLGEKTSFPRLRKDLLGQ